MATLRAYALPLLLALLGGAALLLAWPSPEAGAQPAEVAPAAGFNGGGPWHNSPPLTLQQLRGQVVLVEFWTYSCSNCLNVAPYVHQWHARYAPKGLRVIGVHTPEFAYEGLPGNVRHAIGRLGITWPVVQDNQYRIWNAWGNRFCPALYLVDRQGRVVYRHYGEGDYARTESEIQRLLAAPLSRATMAARRAAVSPASTENAMNHVPHILVVDDDSDIRQMLADYLQRNGLRVSQADGGRAMRALMDTHAVDLVVLDVMMPGEDGLSLCRNLRAGKHRAVPVVLLTARDDETDRIIGLEMGADDYVTKPFSSRELLARINAVIRRTQMLPPNLQVSEAGRQLAFGDWRLDTTARHLLDAQGTAYPLSGAEFRLLRVFLDHANRVLSRDQLLSLTQGRDAELFDRSIDLLVSRVRQRLGDDAREPTYIKTVRSEGYVFSVPVQLLGPEE